MGIVILEESNQPLKVLLLEKEREWVFPKGNPKEGEEFQKAAQREVFEESGVNLEHGVFLGIINRFSYFFEEEQAQKQVIVCLFKLFEYQEINPRIEEGFTDGRWLRTSDALLK